MSISPQAGHPTVSKFSPSIQNAGQIPLPVGSAMRASTVPYLNANLPLVSMRAEVYF